MSPSTLPSSDQPAGLAAPRNLILPALCVFGLFLAFSVLRVPVPAPNEPHYLAKAKHYWNAEFCPGDFFLDSANTHRLFYQTVGWATRFLTLAQTAIAGRMVALLLLAIGWTAFVSRLLSGRWGSLWSAAVFLAISATGNFSGEWIVGGVEAKVFSYAFVFLGLACLFERRWIVAGVSTGLAISFHPVVGIWAVAAAMFAGAVGQFSKRSDLPSLDEPVSRGVAARQIILAMVALLVASLPGLIPAFEVVGSASNEIQFQADYFVVFYRLKHHLDPMDFSWRQYAGYAVLLCLWLIVEFRQPTSRRTEAWFRWFVVGALIIAVAGLVIGFGRRPGKEMLYFAQRMKLMKFYPFRLADVMLPIACSIMLVRLTLATRAGQNAASANQSQRGCRFAWLLCASCTIFALTVPSRVLPSRPTAKVSAQKADWKEACCWIAKNTPADASFLTPRNSVAFKWYAQRAEYVALKDCPQDAAGIVEWNRRLLYRTAWYHRHFDNGYSAAALREFQQTTKITHMLATRQLNAPLEPIYSNEHFSVYRLGELP
jgi:hypothetical protein